MFDYFPFVNYPLPYSFEEMEPYIDIQTMYLHHNKHLQTYVDNLNRTLSEYPALQKISLENMLTDIDRMPEGARQSIRNNGGGVYNHCFYFAGIINMGMKPFGQLEEQILKQYGTLAVFFEQWEKAALSVFGSGYAWLVLDAEKNLTIITTANQDTPLELHLKPLLTIDVWEHAYYLKHKNLRVNYIKDWLEVVNWERAERLYTES